VLRAARRYGDDFELSALFSVNNLPTPRSIWAANFKQFENVWRAPFRDAFDDFVRNGAQSWEHNIPS